MGMGGYKRSALFSSREAKKQPKRGMRKKEESKRKGGKEKERGTQKKGFQKRPPSVFKPGGTGAKVERKSRKKPDFGGRNTT